MIMRFATTLLAMLIVGSLAIQAEAGDAVLRLQDSKEREARKVKLAQMAVAVSELSVGKSRLMLKTPTKADPGGRAGRMDGEFGSSFLTVYPVSMPLAARMLVTTPDNGVVRQYGRILGAVEVISPTGGEDKRKAEPDAYLLFVPINGPLMVDMPLSLVSLTVGEDGRVTHTACASTTVRITPSKLGKDDPSPTVAASIDFLKADLNMTWKEQTYSFSFQMEIIYL